MIWLDGILVLVLLIALVLNLIKQLASLEQKKRYIDALETGALKLQYLDPLRTKQYLHSAQVQAAFFSCTLFLNGQQPQYRPV